MNNSKKLDIEVLSGPLDGYQITLENDTEWTRSPGGLLAFPWDDELGQPQSRFVFEGDQWVVEPFSSPHGTYILNQEKKISEKTAIQSGDLIKASRTWLMIKSIK
jgi:hypothetical protein